MLEEIEARILSLEAQIQAPPPSGALIASALPHAIQTKLQELDKDCGAT
jgi:hypothetical protein